MSPAAQTIDFSIVVPVYNEAEGLPTFWRELHTVLQQLDATSEVVLVDDGSDDESFGIIWQLAEDHAEVRGVSLSRNFGHQIALSAGIERASGDAVITMDADLQHPPNVIPKLIEKYREGFDVVFTKRLDAEHVPAWRRWTSSAFYRFINLLSEVKIEPNAADFRLMGPKAVKAFLQCGEKSRFARGIVRWIGFRQTHVSFEVPRRFAGKSKYTMKKMCVLALDGLTSFSSYPLRVSWLFGMFCVFVAMLYAGYALIEHLRGNTVPGWMSMVLITMALGGVQLFSIGILGEYIGRIFREVKQRPLYFIQDDTGELRDEEFTNRASPGMPR